MSKWISVQVENSTFETYQDEAIRRSRAGDERVTLAQVVKAELNSGAERLRQTQGQSAS